MAAVEAHQKLGEDTLVRNDFCCSVSFAQTLTIGIDTDDDPVVGMVSGVRLVIVQDSCAKVFASILPTFQASGHKGIDKLMMSVVVAIPRQS